MDLFKKKKKYFMAVIEERNGEQKYSHDIIIEAKDETEALILAENIARCWYDSDYSQEEDWIFFHIGVAVKVEYVTPVTPEEFFERHIHVYQEIKPDN